MKITFCIPAGVISPLARCRCCAKATDMFVYRWLRSVRWTKHTHWPMRANALSCETGAIHCSRERRGSRSAHRTQNKQLAKLCRIQAFGKKRFRCLYDQTVCM